MSSQFQLELVVVVSCVQGDYVKLLEVLADEEHLPFKSGVFDLAIR